MQTIRHDILGMGFPLHGDDVAQDLIGARSHVHQWIDRSPEMRNGDRLGRRSDGLRSELFRFGRSGGLVARADVLI